MQKKLKQHEIDEIVKREIIEQTKPEFIILHKSESRKYQKHNTRRISNVWNDPHLTIWMKLWIKIKGWIR
jgi:hypothetical protein